MASGAPITSSARASSFAPSNDPRIHEGWNGLPLQQCYFSLTIARLSWLVLIAGIWGMLRYKRVHGRPLHQPWPEQYITLFAWGGCLPSPQLPSLTCDLSGLQAASRGRSTWP